MAKIWRPRPKTSSTMSSLWLRPAAGSVSPAKTQKKKKRNARNHPGEGGCGLKGPPSLSLSLCTSHFYDVLPTNSHTSTAPTRAYRDVGPGSCQVLLGCPSQGPASSYIVNNGIYFLAPSRFSLGRRHVGHAVLEVVRGRRSPSPHCSGGLDQRFTRGGKRSLSGLRRTCRGRPRLGRRAARPARRLPRRLRAPPPLSTFCGAR